MNSNNFGSREACEKLFKAGIVLETEACWSPIFDFDLPSEKGFLCQLTVPMSRMPISIKDWEFLYREQINASMWALKAIPAVSMYEAWRELPETIKENDTVFWKALSACQVCGDYCSYTSYQNSIEGVLIGSQNYNDNPTDALIDLLIWVRKEKL